jgi:structural maintenance of chromosome 3 (chondroitin sulfate proteoglycan 6)
MADLVKSRTEIECLIEDFRQANVSGEQRRREVAEELTTLEARISDVAERIAELGQELEARVTEEREAKEA